jgi:hypothetical protein
MSDLHRFPVNSRWTLLVVVCGMALPLPLQALPQSAEVMVDFSRDIRPILSDTCFKCHGPDNNTREAGLRLDSRESVFEDSGVVLPGDAESSELYRRLIEEDGDLLMPPPESGRSLTSEQIGLIRKWIEQGAEWGNHWSLVPPNKPRLPAADRDWPRNAIDHFVLQRMQQHQPQLTPAAEADRRTLARRLALDLTGLPPRAELREAFLSDNSPDAYETYVDALLASPRYGEHMARYWLDAVRYGDTHGLHLDNYREHWPYRDWVIEAFNSNQPWDRFSTEQLAGDLLPEPSRQQLIATGFNRAHVTTNEGGSIKDEVKVRNVIDRTATFGTVFLGLTVGCAQCHDHKFDPLSQPEFYSMYAYFNSLDGDPMDGNVKDHAPSMKVASEQQQAELDRLADAITAIDQKISRLVADWNYQEPDDPPAVNPEPVEEIWIDDKLPENVLVQGVWSTSQAGQPVERGEVSFAHTASGNQQYVVQKTSDLWQVHEGDELFVSVYLDPANPPREIMLQWNDGTWEHRAFWGENLIEWGANNSPARLFQGPLPRLGQWVRLSVPASAVGLSPGSRINGLALTQYDGTVYWDSVGKVSRVPPFPANRSLQDWTGEQVAAAGKSLPDDIQKVLAAPPNQWTESQQRQLRDYFIRHVYADARPVIEPLEKQRQALVKHREQLENSIPTTLIYRETAEPVDAFVLNRGQYDQPGEAVRRGVPAALPPLPDSPRNDRLRLARWLFTEQHPLTARVTVNRFWQQVFGRGLVLTAEDFGAQGSFPSHPDLLDYLAVDFRETGWDVKRLMKQMVMSATYRQQSAATPQSLKYDPDNRYLSRGRRYRLDAEVIRDQALAVSGLLVEQLGGPAVKPPQPDGLWFAVGYSGSNTVRFRKDSGHEKVHRRSLYTFWKRTAPPPQMNIMDAPSRETCVVRRERTNTPLQALMLMNDPQYVEAARYLAQRTLQDGGTESDERAGWMFERCLLRPADDQELVTLVAALESFRATWQQDPQAAGQLIAIGEQPASEQKDPVELAAWSMVASLIMNMDEFITRN